MRGDEGFCLFFEIVIDFCYGVGAHYGEEGKYGYKIACFFSGDVEEID